MYNSEWQREDSSARERKLVYGQEIGGVSIREEEGTATTWDGDRDQH